MTTSRLALLLAVLLGGLSCAFMIPQKPEQQPAGITLHLPEFLGEWWGQELPVTAKEIATLGPGTEFARRRYENGLSGRVDASIVLSGQDMMTSIHRPERCLDAQGWTFGVPERRMVDIPGGKFQVMRINKSKDVKLQDGKDLRINNISYYWFVGSKDITPSHLERVLIDSRDRLLQGTVQRWAMLMVSADVTAGREKFGLDERGVDKLLEGFMTKLVPKVHKPDVAQR